MRHDKWTDYCSRTGIPNYLRPCARLRTLTREELPTLGGGQVTIESVLIDVIVVPVLSHKSTAVSRPPVKEETY